MHENQDALAAELCGKFVSQSKLKFDPCMIVLVGQLYTYRSLASHRTAQYALHARETPRLGVELSETTRD